MKVWIDKVIHMKVVEGLWVSSKTCRKEKIKIKIKKKSYFSSSTPPIDTADIECAVYKTKSCKHGLRHTYENKLFNLTFTSQASLYLSNSIKLY